MTAIHLTNYKVLSARSVSTLVCTAIYLGRPQQLLCEISSTASRKLAEVCIDVAAL